MNIRFFAAMFAASVCASSSMAADLEMVFTSQRLSTNYVDRLGELYVGGSFFSYVRERVARTGVEAAPALADGTWRLQLTKNGDVMSGEFRNSVQSISKATLIADAKSDVQEENVGILLTRSPKGEPPADSSLMFKFFEKLGVDSEGDVVVHVVSWIDGRVVKLSAFPIFEEGTDKTKRTNLTAEKFTPGLVIENINNFNWATQSSGIVSFFLPKGVAGMRFEYITKAFPKIDPANGDASAPRHETNDVTQMKFKLNSFEPLGQFTSVKDSESSADFIVATRANSNQGIPPSETELQAANGGTPVEPEFGTTARVGLQNGTIEKWKFASEWTLNESIDGVSFHRWFYKDKANGEVTFKEGRNDLALTPIDVLSIQRINVYYFVPFPRTEWQAADRILTLRCKSPISQVVFSNEDLAFSPVRVDPKDFLISWGASGFQEDEENNEGFFIELRTQRKSVPDATFKIAERADSTRGAGPTAAELEAANGSPVTAAEGNTALVTLNDKTLELWKFTTGWQLEERFEPHEHFVLSRKVRTRTLETGETEELVELLFAGKLDEPNGLTAYKVSPFENANDGQNGYVVLDLPTGISSARVEFKRQTGIQ